MSEYPYIERQTVWGNTFDFFIADFQSEDWYGLKGYQRKLACSPEEAEKRRDGWNDPLKALVHVGDVVIDCGSHAGHTSLVFAKRVLPGGRVIAIEASPNNVEKVKKNIEINKIENLRVENKAVCEVSGLDVHVQSEVVNRDGKGYSVKSVRLDDYLQDKPTMIKVDIEGFEVEALRGATELLKTRPKIEIELHLGGQNGLGVDMRKMGYDPRELWDTLIRNGYGINKYQGNEFVKMTVEEFDKRIDGCVWCF